MSDEMQALRAQLAEAEARWHGLRVKVADAYKGASIRSDMTGGYEMSSMADAYGDVVDWMRDALPAAPTLDTTLADVLAWQRATFGAPSLPSNLRKLRGEVDELCDSASGGILGDATRASVLAELADVIIMAAGVADALGLTLAAVTEVVAAKLEINRARPWRQNADGTWSHVKGCG